MRAIKPSNRRRSLWSTVLLGFIALAIGGVGTVAALGYLKVIDLERLAFWRKTQPIPADWVAVPMCARPIPAYTSVTRDYMVNPRTAEWIVIPMPPGAIVKARVIAERSKILGRVTAHEVPGGYCFTEADFLPLGTSPGVAGGTPPGKLAMTLDASKLKGMCYDLKAGDHVVLQASTAVDMPGAGHSNSGQLGTKMVATPDMLLLPKRSFIRTLVQDGVVVMPVQTRNVPISSSSLTQGATTRTMPVQEIIIAVDPQDVPLLNEAIDLKYEITCLAQSGRPVPVPSSTSNSPAGEDSQGGVTQFLAALAKAVLRPASAPAPEKAASPGSVKSVNGPKSESPAKNRVAMYSTPGLDPMAQIRFMEVMIGPQRQFVLFNGPGNSPLVALQDDGLAKGSPGVVPAGAAVESKQ